MTSKQILALAMVLTTVSLTACNDTSKKSKRIGRADHQGKAVSVAEDYQFEVNGCDTGKQRVQADSDEELKKKVCEALQNESLNQSCAPEARKARFEQRCEGMTWKPFNTPTGGSDEDAQTLALKESLKLVFLKDFTAEPQTDPEVEAVAEKLLNAMFDCGTSFSGPTCLGETLSNSKASIDVMNEKPSFASIVESELDGISYILVFTLNEASEVTEELSVYLLNEDFDESKSLDENLFAGALEPLATANLDLEPIELLKKRLGDAENLEQLYHAAHALFYTEKTDLNKDALTDINIEIVDAFTNQIELITEGHSLYKIALLKLLYKELKEQNILLVVSELLNSTDEKVRQLAATISFAMDSSKVELKELVQAAADSSEDKETQKLAREALAESESNE